MARPLVDDLDRHIALRLKKLRRQRGVSAQDLAETIDSTQQQISRYENGHNKLSATQLYRIAAALGMPVSWFFLDYQAKQTTLVLAEEPAHYEKNLIEDELLVVAKLWLQLTPDKRAAAIRIIEALVK